MSKRSIESFGRLVHASWRMAMLRQGRDVAPERMKWETLSLEDKQLDIFIGLTVAQACANTISDMLTETNSEPNIEFNIDELDL